jgi:pyrimidine-nucleoside phosphorylase
VPMMSGRGLGHTGGTLDKLEAIPGFRVGLSVDEFRDLLGKIGVAMISQTADVAPADKALYALRDVTGTVESIPLITASILSKKIAEGISALVLDVKCGRGAFMKTLPDARRLAQSLVRVGAANGLKIEAVITDMESPLGAAVGNAIEVSECLSILEGNTDGRLAELSILLAAKMLKLSGLARDDADGIAQCHGAIADRRALRKFHELVSAQGGMIEKMDNTTKCLDIITAEHSGFIADLDAEKIGIAAMILGAGRATADDVIDHAAKVECHAIGKEVTVGAPLFFLGTNRLDTLAEARRLLQSAVTISVMRPEPLPLVLETIS